MKIKQRTKIFEGLKVGTAGYVRHELSFKVKEVAIEVSQIVKVMKGEGQVVWTVDGTSQQ